MIRRLLAGLLIALAPVAAFAQIMLTGVGAGASVNYVPAAMLFNYDTWVGSTSPIGAADVKPATFAWWWFGNWNGTNTTTVQNDWLFLSNPSNIGAVNSTCETTGTIAPGVCFSLDSPLHGQFNLNDSVGTNNTHAIRVSSTAANAALTPINQWNFQIVTVDPASGHYGVYLNGVDVTASYAPGSTVIANVTPSWLTATGGFGLANGRGNGFVISYIWLSEIYLDNVAHLNGGGNGVDPAFAAKLYSGGLPVYTGPDCSLPTGTAPPVCIHYAGGNAVSNTGSAQTSPFTVQTATWNNALAGTGKLSAAPYGPAGIPAHQATTRWFTGKKLWNPANASTSGAVTSDGGAITTGDVLWINTIFSKTAGDVVQYFIGSNVADGSCTSGTNCSCPTGWGQLAPMNDTYRLTISLFCYHKTVGGDTGGSYTLTWNALANQKSGSSFIMGDIANVAAIEAVNENTTWLVVGSRTLTPSTTNTTTTHAADSLISVMGQAACSDFTAITEPAAGDTLFRELLGTGNQACFRVVEEHGLANGASTSRQWTFTEGANDTFHPYSLVLQSN